jgi:hypothetical protein
MKRFNDLQDARDRELLSIYRDKLINCATIDLDQICRDIAVTPTSRFWVNEKIALDEMYYIRKHGCTSRTSETYREMFMEIYKRVCELRLRKPSMSLRDAVERIVQSPAPRFYLTPKSIKVVICKAKRRLLEERKRKLRFLF